jgi:hypothetical protein
MREVFNAIRYVNRTGCQWRQLPKDFPPHTTVYNYFWEWCRYGVLSRIHQTLLEQSRRECGREPDPTAGIIDTQVAKATEKGGSPSISPRPDVGSLRKADAVIRLQMYSAELIPCQRSSTVSDYDNVKLVELARYLLADDASLIDEVQLAIDRPNDYVGRFQERLSERGIHKPQDDLPWIALVDGLMARGRLDEIDYRGTWDEVQSAMVVLTGRKEDWAWLAAPEWHDKQAHEMIPVIEARLSRKGLALVAINILSDSYPLMVLPLDRVEEAGRLAQLAGYGPILLASKS